MQVSVPVFQSDQVFPDDDTGLGGGWTTGLPAGLQHAELADPPQESQLPPPRLQLQLEARQNTHHQGALLLWLQSENAHNLLIPERWSFLNYVVNKLLVFV